MQAMGYTNSFKWIWKDLLPSMQWKRFIFKHIGRGLAIGCIYPSNLNFVSVLLYDLLECATIDNINYKYMGFYLLTHIQKYQFQTRKIKDRILQGAHLHKILVSQVSLYVC